MSKFRFNEKIEEFESFQKKEMMEELAKATLEHFVDNFDSKSFDGKAWPDGKDYHGLEDTGELREALEDSIQSVSKNGFEIEVVSDYGSYQNDGTEELPARTFVGQEDKLSKLQEDIIKNNVTKIFAS